MSDNPHSSNTPLTSKLDELESLLDEQETPAMMDFGYLQRKSPGIPILDEVITDEYYEDPDLELENQEPEDIRLHLSDIAERLEQKLSSELDEIVSILKGTLKESIMSELQTRLYDQVEPKNDEE